MDVQVIKLGTSLVPKINNPYAEAKSLSLYQPEEWADIEHNFR
ncbi:transcription elongation factor GreAB [Lacticaseibacillus paracasei]